MSRSLLDGTAFAANDCIVILPPGDMSPTNAHVESNVADTFVEVAPLDLNFDDDGFADFSRSYYGGTAMTLTAPPQSAGRRFVRWLVDGAPQPIGMRTAEWASKMIGPSARQRLYLADEYAQRGDAERKKRCQEDYLGSLNSS